MLARWSEALAACSSISEKAASRRAATSAISPPRLSRLGGQLVPLAFERLPALHQLEHDLLQVALPAVQVLDLRLQARELARGRDLPGVQPGPVPLDPGPDLVHVAFGPALLPAQVAELGFGRHQGVLELAGPGLQAAELGDFGQAAPAVVEAAELGVQVGQFEQAELDLR